MVDIELKNVNGHIEVYENGRFLFSSDSRTEAEKDLLDYESKKQESK